jgi:hypothetical protein
LPLLVAAVIGGTKRSGSEYPKATSAEAMVFMNSLTIEGVSVLSLTA